MIVVKCAFWLKKKSVINFLMENFVEIERKWQ